MSYNVVYMIGRKAISMTVSLLLLRKQERKSQRGDFMSHVGSNAESYEDQHGDYANGVKNKKE